MKRIGNLLLIPMSIFLLGISGCGVHQTKGDKIDLSHQNQDSAISGQSIREWKRLNSQFIKTFKAGDYPTAKGLAERALIFAEREFGHEYVYTLTSLNNLAELYRVQGLYEKAEPLCVKT